MKTPIELRVLRSKFCGDGITPIDLFYESIETGISYAMTLPGAVFNVDLIEKCADLVIRKIGSYKVEKGGTVIRISPKEDIDGKGWKPMDTVYHDEDEDARGE